MNKQDIFETILASNGYKLPTQKDCDDFVLDPRRDYPFDSSIITSYIITRTSDNLQLQVLPENLWKYLKEITESFDQI